MTKIMTTIPMLFILIGCDSPSSKLINEVEAKKNIFTANNSENEKLVNKELPKKELENKELLNTSDELSANTISAIKTKENSTVISWALNKHATGQIEYGTDSDYGYYSVAEKSYDWDEHTIPIENLKPSTTYHYRIISKDEEGNKVVSDDKTFTTKQSENTTEAEVVNAEVIKTETKNEPEVAKAEVVQTETKSEPEVVKAEVVQTETKSEPEVAKAEVVQTETKVVDTSTLVKLENIGAQAVTSTDASKGTKYASPNGNGSGESLDDPADIEKAFSTLVAGDVLFLKGGVYDVSNKFLAIHAKGTSSNPIIVESYPGEKAILDLRNQIDIKRGVHVGDAASIQLKADAEYVQIRKIVIANSGREGVVVYGSHNLIEGNEIYNAKIAGIRIDSTKFDGSSWTSGYNIVQNNLVHDNSDVGLTHGNYKNGGNADGISISGGNYNKVLHNTVYDNSDDGIDTWHSNDSEVAYNIVHGHGKGEGNGGGIKLGGNLNTSILSGMRAYAHHNISYGNRSMGFNLNAGRGVRIENNTAYNNGQYGFVLGSYEKLGNYTPSLKNNISFENNKGDLDINHEKGQENNSWQMDDSIEFISTDSQSNGFLRPVIDSDMGAISYSNI